MSRWITRVRLFAGIVGVTAAVLLVTVHAARAMDILLVEPLIDTISKYDNIAIVVLMVVALIFAGMWFAERKISRGKDATFVEVMAAAATTQQEAAVSFETLASEIKAQRSDNTLQFRTLNDLLIADITQRRREAGRGDDVD